MCIAIVKPMGTRLPDKELLRRCWDNNPDGAGLMYNDGEKVVIHKGFTKFKGFYKYLKNLDKIEDLQDKDLVLHFRIATSGGVNRECTHPFPVTKDIEDMKKLDNVCKYGFAHNGIISGYGTKDFSDTMEYISNIISNIRDLDDSEPLLDALAYEHASRFVVLTSDNFELGGRWIKDGECYFSNTTYKEDYYTNWKQKWYKTKDGCYIGSTQETAYCDCCDGLFFKDELVSTGYGKICLDCYEELLGEEREELEATEQEAKELIF